LKKSKDMCKRTNIEFGITEGFVADEKRLSDNDRREMGIGLNRLGDDAREDNVRKLFRNNKMSFPNTIKREQSSLYMFKATNNLRVVLAYDDDPIFDKKIITLYRVVNKKDSVIAFNSTANLLYGPAEH